MVIMHSDELDQEADVLLDIRVINCMCVDGEETIMNT